MDGGGSLIVDIPRCRLQNQGIEPAPFETPHDAVHWLGAVQAQDYRGSLWAVGLRMRQATERGVEQAIAERTIVRSWPLRGTLHYAAAEDVRWMLHLTAPGVVAARSGRFRQLGLDGADLAASRRIATRALRDGRPIGRKDLLDLLAAGGVSPVGQRGFHILVRLALEGLICPGPRDGTQQTYVLLDEWIPPAASVSREDALTQLATRYFASRGPATARDFAWWSGLTVADARTGATLAGPRLASERVGDDVFWFAPSPHGLATASPASPAPSSVHLLPPFDEYTVAYRDRSAVLDPAFASAARSINGIARAIVVVDGQVVGTWRRVLGKDAVAVEARSFPPERTVELDGVGPAAERYARFLGRTAVIGPKVPSAREPARGLPKDRPA